MDKVLSNNSADRQTDRNYALDIYRFLCMFLITSIHLKYIQIESIVAESTINSFSLYVLQTFELIGINGFVLISAFYLSKSVFSIKRIINFWIQLIFYSVFIFSIMTLLKGFSVRAFLKSFFPIMTQHYWYSTDYIILLSVAPFLNRLISALNRSEFSCLLLVTFFVEALLLSANIFYDCEIYFGHNSHSILWFIFLYLIAAFIQKYGLKVRTSTLLIIFWSAWLVAFAYMFVESYHHSIGRLKNFQIIQNNGVCALVMTVSSFELFRRLGCYVQHGKLCSFIKFVTPALFAVYIIQEHDSVRSFFWEEEITTYVLPITHNPIIIAGIAFAFLLFSAVVLNSIYMLMKKAFLASVSDYLSLKIPYINLNNINRNDRNNE